MTELTLFKTLFSRTCKLVDLLKLLWHLRCSVMLAKSTWRSMEPSSSTSVKLLRRTTDTVLTTPTLNSETFILSSRSWNHQRYLPHWPNCNAALLLMALPLLLSAVRHMLLNTDFKTRLLKFWELILRLTLNLPSILQQSTWSEEKCQLLLLNLYTNNQALVLKMFRFANYMIASPQTSYALMRLLDYAPLEEPALLLITMNSLMVAALLSTPVVDSSLRDILLVLLVSPSALSFAGNSEEWHRSVKLITSKPAFNTI